MKINEIEKNLKRILDDAMQLRRSKEHPDFSELKDFLSEYVVYPDIKDDFRNDPGELERLKAQNLMINWVLAYIDTHPCSEINYIAEPVRAEIWKCAGIKCDDFSKVHIGKGIRFFNPRNVILAAGGNDIFFAGLRAPTFLDGRSKLVIFGPATIGAGVKIYTHDHVFDNPNLVHWKQGRVYISCIIYPDCFIGDDIHIFGGLEIKTVLADMSIKRPKKVLPPYSIIGGIGKEFRVIKYIDFPQPFPPKHLAKTLENVKTSFAGLGFLLERYYKIVKKLKDMPGDREENWKLLREKINTVEKKVLQKL